MPTFILYKDFKPKEIDVNGNCIWCGNPVEKNRAHIFSRKIIRRNSQYNVLKKTVCVHCNTTIGSNIEDFLFKKTPLGYLADMFLQREFRSLKWVPNYFWSTALDTWVIAIHDKKAKTDVLPNQVMLDADSRLMTFLNNNDNAHVKNKELIKNASLDLEKKKFSIHVSSMYPNNFFPRAFYLNAKLILTGKNNLEIDKLKHEIINCKEDSEFIVGKRGDKSFTEKLQINFQWDVKTYIDYCAKIAFEFFSLMVGREPCLEEGFQGLRKSILGYRSINPLEVTYTEEKSERVFSNKLVPEGWISYVEIEEKVAIFPLTNSDDNFNHSIFLYELDNGLVCATVKLFNIHVAQLILGRRKPSLSFNCWRIEYNTQTSEMIFHKFINDQEKIASIQREYSDKLPKDSTITGSPNLIWKDIRK